MLFSYHFIPLFPLPFYLLLLRSLLFISLFLPFLYILFFTFLASHSPAPCTHTLHTPVVFFPTAYNHRRTLYHFLLFFTLINKHTFFW